MNPAQKPPSNRWSFSPNRHYFDGERYPAPYYRMNTLTLYICPGAPCPSWQTPPCANRDMQIRGDRPRPPHANIAKQKNERTNPIPPNPNHAILVQRNPASIPSAIDLKPMCAACPRWVHIYPQSLYSICVGANGYSPVRALFRAQRLHRIHARRPRPSHTNFAKQKNERTNPIPGNANAAMIFQRNLVSIPRAIDVKLPSTSRASGDQVAQVRLCHKKSTLMNLPSGMPAVRLFIKVED